MEEQTFSADTAIFIFIRWEVSGRLRKLFMTCIAKRTPPVSTNYSHDCGANSPIHTIGPQLSEVTGMKQTPD
ncbi:uncharacterized protein FOMMEDRAFT_170484 [Fomitiporia mediterranea MF3/22]|uniref:uncharacterized protein n=1 Tax=Fomitiporia mediterranea (strain MF3/22) TaxID=694068 RepID=UPI00044095F2|nr:uncharacterized protein FOMMEDRAFT_170484 [Fomitiporia mediterranea MF3/22]EJC99102.1 hypothetical protein FOMMEDRAFT_170484 [Fomitiporia mediterranea MF3/22]